MKAIEDALGVLGKVDRAVLTTELRKRKPADPRRLPRGWTVYYKHHRPADGTHLATTHALVTADGTVVHRHCEEILIGQARFFIEAE